MEEVVEADVSPGGGDRVSDGEEDGGSETEWRLTEPLLTVATYKMAEDNVKGRRMNDIYYISPGKVQHF